MNYLVDKIFKLLTKEKTIYKCKLNIFDQIKNIFLNNIFLNIYIN
jgi:hypothetical protein